MVAMSRVVRVVLVDDEESNLEVVQDVLLDYPRINLVGYAPNPIEFRALVEKSVCDVALIDMNLGGAEDGLSVLKWLVKEHPLVRPIILTSTTQAIPDAYREGAYGYLLKSHWEEVGKTVERVSAGEVCMPASVIRAVLEYVSAQQQNVKKQVGIEKFTPKEQEVLKSLRGNLPREELLTRLDITPKTLKRHLENIRERTGFSCIRDVLEYYAEVL